MEDIVTDFLCGFDSFQKDVNPQLLEKLRETQNPKALVIACSDSRVDPAILFSCSPGDIFVIRNVANIVPRYTPGSSIHGVSAAIEYAIVYLNVSHIILLGHSNCGGHTEIRDCSKNTKCFKGSHSECLLYILSSPLIQFYI